MQPSVQLFALLRLPSAWIPLVLSLCSLMLVIGYVLMVGVPETPLPAHDEGAPAHLYQLLMLVQLPFIAYFLCVWLPKLPMQAMVVLALQVLGLLAVFLPVYLLGM